MQKKIKEIRAQIENELRTRFPNTFNFDRKRAAGIVGCVPGHLSNCEVKGKPLIIPAPLGRKVVYPFNNVVNYLTEQQSQSLKPRRGARSKAERIAALETEGGRDDQSL